MSDHFFVVTGGLGAGKTTLIEELARHGFHTIPESGRAIIRDEVEGDGSALPWAGVAWPQRCWNATCAPTEPHRRSPTP